MYHQELADWRRQKMSLMQQLGNIGSEVSRVCSSYENNNTARFESALARMLELFSMTLGDTQLRYAQRTEIARLKEYILDYFLWDKQYWQTPSIIMKDFNYYWMLANKKHSLLKK